MAILIESKSKIIKLDALIKFFDYSLLKLMDSPLAPNWHDGKIACYNFNNPLQTCGVINKLKQVGLKNHFISNESNAWLEINPEIWPKNTAQLRGDINGTLIGPHNFSLYQAGSLKALRMRATILANNEDGHTLLVRDKNTKLFSLPGGGLNKCEPVLAAAAREIYEELGIVMSSIRRRIDLDFSSSHNRHLVAETFLTKSAEIIKNTKEISEYIWWDRVDPVMRQSHVDRIIRSQYAITRNRQSADF
jgi:8-oxo-dGTP pyrophosphatase MutT (NUDIX family)